MPSRTVLLLGILLLAAALRVEGVAFGFPSLYDPDEPVFVLSALQLLRGHTLNPGWFGHPGTTTIYALALVELVVYAIGYVTGRFTGTASFVQAIYTDPTVVFLPGRLLMVAFGLACIGLTFILGKRLFDVQVGLLAAALLAIDPIHIRYSQLIRTDMHATVFMLLFLIAAMGIVTRGRLRDYLHASLWLGFACATKWPAVTIVAGMVGAASARAIAHPQERLTQLRHLGVGAAASVMALFFASPYLFIDYPTVLVNLHGEARPHHLGATGHGALANAWWYLVHPLRNALGITGLALAAPGLVIGIIRSRVFLVTAVPVMITFLVAISVQALIWERWVVPLLPLLTIAVAVSIVAIARWAAARSGARSGVFAAGAACLIVVVPSTLAARGHAAERRNDTRRMASAWARAHIPPGKTLLLEIFAFDLLDRPWHFLMPLGDQCVDAVATLKGDIPYAMLETLKKGRALSDLGTISPPMLATCHANFAILTDYDRYWQEAARYPRELAIYERLIADGSIVATFRPEPGKIGGPIVRIVRIGPAT